MKKIRLKKLVGCCLIVCMVFSMMSSNLRGMRETKVEAASNPYVYTYYNSNGGLCYNCTWYAWQRAYEKVGVVLPGFTGNAKGWYQGAINAGYAVGSEPRENSIIVWTDSTYGHVGFVESVEGNNVTVSEAGTNYGSSSYACNTYDKEYLKARWGQTLLGYIYLTPQSYNPEGKSDSISGGKGCVKVVGWTFDRDAIASPIDVHVYLDDVCLGGWTAGVSRTDVDSVYHCGQFHGYDLTIPTDVTGNHHVRVYAINVSGGTNVILGEADVYIEPADSEKPNISDVKVVESDSQGYFLECKVSDNNTISKVQCPTWTVKNDQDDIAADWINNSSVSAVKEGNVYRYRVNISDHNNEYGTYKTHIYAFDSSGNYSSVEVIVDITKGILPHIIEKKDNSLVSIYEETLSWKEMNAFAESMGSYLVSVNNEEENKIISNLIKRSYRTQYYMGGYRLSKYSSWIWKDGSRFSYDKWREGEPNCYEDNEFYICMVRDGEGEWNDISNTCDNTGFIIETPLDLEEVVSIETENKIYKFYNEEMPYTLAEEFCRENGAMLVCIESEEENNLIAKKVKQLGKAYYIGANDAKEEGVFEWVNGTVVSYSNWAEQEPNNAMTNGGEDYVQMYVDGTWNDASGQLDNVGFIAEFDKVTSPEPTQSPSSTVTPSEQPTPTTPSSETPIEIGLKGDMNSDGKVDLKDANITLKVALGITTLENEKLADVNEDNAVNLKDAHLILKAALGILVL